MIQAVFTDVDGTLLNSSRELSDRTIRAIRAISHNVTVVLASSRMPSAMRHLQVELGIEDHPLICYNGGYVLSSGLSNQVYASHVIPREVCKGILAHTAGGPVHISLYHEDNWYARERDRWTDREQQVTKVSPQILPFNEVIAKWEHDGAGAHKIMCMGEAPAIAALYDWLYQHYHQQIHIYKSRPTYLELATNEVSKASGMTLIMRNHLHGTNDQAIAYGDNFNDIEMLRAAGIGVSVENAIQEVKEVAAEITAAGKDDGVARSLEKHFQLVWES